MSQPFDQMGNTVMFCLVKKRDELHSYLLFRNPINRFSAFKIFCERSLSSVAIQFRRRVRASLRDSSSTLDNFAILFNLSGCSSFALVQTGLVNLRADFDFNLLPRSIRFLALAEGMVSSVFSRGRNVGGKLFHL